MKKVVFSAFLVLASMAITAQDKLYVCGENNVEFEISAVDSISFIKPERTTSLEGLNTEISNLKEDTARIKKEIVSLEGTLDSLLIINNEIRSKADSLQGKVYVLDGTVGKGLFSVSATKKIRFAQGNLQYLAKTDTWRMADSQLDFIGIGYGVTKSELGPKSQTDPTIVDLVKDSVGGNVINGDNTKIGEGCEFWIDLFGFGDLTGKKFSMGTKEENIAEYVWTKDWGTKIGEGRILRVLTKAEWDYIINTRESANDKLGLAYVNGANGMILLPDNYTHPEGLAAFKSGVGTVGGTSYLFKEQNDYTLEEWKKMEAEGAVFLPAGGYREKQNVYYVGCRGRYWTNTKNTDERYNSFNFDSKSKNLDSRYVYTGQCVRLILEEK